MVITSGDHDSDLQNGPHRIRRGQLSAAGWPGALIDRANPTMIPGFEVSDCCTIR